MRTVSRLPDVLSVTVGTRIRCKGREYEKAKSGRWSVVLTPELLSELSRAYEAEGLSLRETKARINRFEGLPGVNVQKILEDTGMMRSHYGRAKSEAVWFSTHKEIIRLAHCEIGIPVYEIARWAHVNRERLGALCHKSAIKDARPGRTESDALRKMSGWLEEREIEAWNRLMKIDASTLTFRQYQLAVGRLSCLVAKRYGLFASRKSGFDLDHKLSKYYGYHTTDSVPTPSRSRSYPRKTPISLRIMAHPANLRLVRATVNAQKHHMNLLSEEELIDKIYSKGTPLPSWISYDLELASTLKRLGLTKHQVK